VSTEAQFANIMMKLGILSSFHKKYSFTSFAVFMLIFVGDMNKLMGQTRNKVISIDYSKEEKKALRVEMIEMDITIRTIASMISLNNSDRLEALFLRLKTLQTADSVYYKTAIAATIKKWKKKGLLEDLLKIQSESNTILDYLKEVSDSKNKDEIQWNIIYQANQKILESCQNCHKSSGVNIQ